MTIVLLTDLGLQWMDKITSQVADQAIVLRAPDTARAMELLRSVPISVIVSSMESLTTERLLSYEQMAQAAPAAVRICLAPQAVIEQVRTEELLAADFWLRPSATAAEIAEVVTSAIQKANLVASGTRLQAFPTNSVASAVSPDDFPPMPEVFHRLMSGLAGGFDTDRLLTAYVEAVAELVRCASYCLLWRAPDKDCFTVYAAQGLHPEIVAQGRLLPTDSLPMWYHHNCRVLTRSELADWPDRALAVGLAGELEVFRAQVAVPLMIEGRLAGLLMLGEKVIGKPYSLTELETLFLLANYVALQAQSFELHAQLRRSKAYVECILSGMSSGVITLGQDERITVCNPYAAQILQLPREQVEGADLRCLPSPLGDYLYGAIHSPDKAVVGEEVTIQGGQLTLRVSTSPLLDDNGIAIGSVMLLEDITAQIVLATERHRRERLDMLTQIVGHLAHEVKTPLQAIKTYSELMGRPQPDEELTDFWRNTVAPEIARLNELTNQLVQMVQQPEPNFELVRLESLVEEAISHIDGPSQAQEPVYKLEIDEPLPRVVADPAPTQEALSYLLRYLRGTDGSSVHVRITQDETELGDSVCVGMQRSTPSNDVHPEELFDPFYALQQTDAALGPAISRKIVENQGGKVEAQAENGHLEFRVVFPVTVLGAVRRHRK